MNHQKISTQVQEKFRLMIKDYNGQVFRGTLEVDIFEPFRHSLMLNSSVYRERLESESCIPDMPKPYDVRLRHPIPEGIFFRAEIAKKPGDAEHFLASMCEGTGQEYLFRAHIATNDPDYVRTHPDIKWTEQ